MQEVEQRREQLPRRGPRATTPGMEEVGQRMEQLPRDGLIAASPSRSSAQPWHRDVPTENQAFSRLIFRKRGEAALCLATCKSPWKDFCTTLLVPRQSPARLLVHQPPAFINL